MNMLSINLDVPQKCIFPSPLKLGGRSPQGREIAVNNYFITFDGRPFFGIAGEFHFSRCPCAFWEEELLKMKAAGVNAVSTYVFWNHHEEEEGVFRWDGDRNLRRFLELCAALGLLVFLRIGPFAHGEARNGGFPDWLYGMPFTVRSNDEGYLAYAERLFVEIGKQAAGLLFRDGGPVVGIQLENEHNAASAPWEFLVVNEYEWVHKGSGGEGHIRALKALANGAGLEAPLYTCTGWDGGSCIRDETLPVWGGYCWQPWTVNDGSAHEPSFECVIRDFHEGNFQSGGFTPSSTGGRAPYVCMELGGGMACWYKYRFVAAPESVLASTVARVAGGCNFLGYYMFHDGTNPVGKRGYLNERTVPKISYHFQAPIGEYGQIRDSYKLLKPLFYFLREQGESLCQMATAMPSGAECILPEDCESLRAAARHKGGSGFLFLVNYQDHAQMPDRESVQVALNLPDETLRIPEGKGFALKSGVSAVLPFNMELGGALLKYATVQYVASVQDEDARTCFFFTPEGMEGEYCFDTEGLDLVSADAGCAVTNGGGFLHVAVTPGPGSEIVLAARGGGKVRVCTLTAAQARNLWICELWGRERAILSNADIFIQGGCVAATRAGSPEMELSVFPGVSGGLTAQCGKVEGVREGVFTAYRFALPKREVCADVRLIAGGKAAVTLPADALDGLEDVLLRVDYLGSVGNAFIGGRLVADNFCNGQVWEIGLRRFFPEIAEKGMYLHVIPYRRGSDVVFEPGAAFRHEFGEGEAAQIYSVEAVPVYRALIRKL